MANADFPMGAVPHRKTDGTSFVLQYHEISSSNSAIYEGDFIEARNDGYAHPAQASSVTIFGVSAKYIPANTGGTVPYYPAENSIFIMQSDDATIAAQTNLLLNYNIVATAGSATTGRSAMEIDGNTGATTADLPIKVLRLVTVNDTVGNDITLANAKFEVIINQSATKGGGAVGV